MFKMDNVFKKILIFLIYSNIYLSIGASAVALVSAKLLGFSVNWLIIFIPFSAGMLIYNLNRYTDVIEDSINVPERVHFVYKYGKLFIFIGIIMYIISLIYSSVINFTIFILTLLPVVIALVYSVFRLKSYLFIKNILVGIAWGIAALLPATYYNSLNLSSFILFLFFAVQFFTNTVIFDIKDIKGDRLKGIKTIPNTLGINKTKLICNTASIISIMLIFLGIIYRLLPLQTLVVLLPFTFYVMSYTYYSHKNKNAFFYGLFVDGEFIFLLFIFFISHLLNII